MPQIFVVVTDTQDAPLVIGPLTDGITDELYAEIESWGWTIYSGYARRLSLAQARREAQQPAER
jgi:hypothetical protein